MSISVFWLTFATCMVKARTFLTCQSFLGSTPNLLPVWLHFWVQARYWQGEHRRLHALVFISLSKITIITKLIMARFYHMRGRYYPSKDTNICDPWRTQIFLQAIFGGVSPERCHYHPPTLAKCFQTLLFMISSLSDVPIVCPTVRAPTTRVPCLRLLWEGLSPWKSKDL